MIKRTMTCLLLLGLISTGCTMELVPVMPEQGNGPESLSGEGTVRFTAVQVADTRSSISIDENRLADVNIYAYCDGLLYAHAYSTTPETVSLKLKKGTTYNLYAVANTAEMGPLQKESDFISRFHISLESIADLGGKNLMAWEQKGFVLSSSTAEVNMQMTRLYSKVHFKLDRGVLKGLEVKSVKLCQAAKSVSPFLPGGSRATTAEEVMDGDFANAADLAQLNSTGEGIFFYTLENRQGSLLPSNTDPWKKTPDNIAGKENLCTFIEVTASFKEGFFYSGSVTYRFYLGQDNTTNFDVLRNNDTSVLLTLSGDNYGEGQQDISWKVILDTGMKREGYANYRIGKHVNPDNRLCVTERFEFLMSLKDEIFNHFDRDQNNFYVSAIDPVTEKKTGDIISLTALQPVASAPDDNRFRCIGTVHKPGQWKYGLFDSRSDRLVSIIHNEASTSAYDEAGRPILVVGCNPSNYYEKDTPAVINGKETVYYLYAADNSTGTGILNRKGVFSGGEGNSIDLSQYSSFNFQFELAGPQGTVPADNNLVFSRYEPVREDEDVPYVGRIYFKAVNDGITDQDLLIDLIADNSPDPSTLKDFRMYATGCSDKFNVIQSEAAFPFAIEPIEVRVFAESDSDWGGGVYDVGHTMKIRNSSKLPLRIDCLMHILEGDFHCLTNQINCDRESTVPVNGFVLTGAERNTSMAFRSIRADLTASGSNLKNKRNGDCTYLRLYMDVFNYAPGGAVPDIDIRFLKSNGVTVENSGYGFDDFVLMPLSSMSGHETQDKSAYHILRSGSGSSASKDHGVIDWETSSNGVICNDIHRYVTHEEWRKLLQDGAVSGGCRLTFDKKGIHFNNETQMTVTMKTRVQHAQYKDGTEKYLGSTYFNPGNNISHIEFSNQLFSPNTINTQWESAMNQYHTGAYRKEYWHTLIHTKAGHHVVHPLVDEVFIEKLEMVKKGTPDWGKTLHECPSISREYRYTRDHIDRDSEKNDDSAYGYSVLVRTDINVCKYNGIFVF